MKIKYIYWFNAMWILLLVCGLYVVTRTLTFENKIIKTMKHSETIDLAMITDFRWNKLYILQPYSDVKTFLGKEGIHSPDRDYAIKLSDDIYMFAFVEDNELIQYIDLPIEYITFTKYIECPIKYSSDQSKFNISEKKIVIEK